MQAAWEGDLETIMTCLAYKCPVQWVEPETGATALHRACEAGQVVAVEFLLQNGGSAGDPCETSVCVICCVGALVD